MQILLCAILLIFMTAAGRAEEPPQDPENPSDLTKISLEDLMHIEITSVSKREQNLSTAPSAIYVITAEDIRRSGATSIPEALRMVPGLDVARIDMNQWAISARGFNGLFSNKMLVLIDGRSVYSPVTSGVNWDAQDTMLEDVERIEVIRGPGATLWGANAVNGVINIITKAAKDTQGGLAVGGAGSAERGFGSARYGGKIGRNTYYRVYGKYFSRDTLVNPSFPLAPGGWDSIQGGFRADWKGPGRDALTFQGDLYHGNISQRSSNLVSILPPFSQVSDATSKISGGNALARWTRTFSKESNVSLQWYYDQTYRDDISSYGGTVRTNDIDFQHHLTLGPRHDLVWGLGHRVTADTSRNTFSDILTPKSRTAHLFSAFVQDEFQLAKDRLRLIFGSKFEHSTYASFETQPSARLLWTPNDHQTVWAAVGRAVRTPARTDWDHRVIFGAFLGQTGVPNVLTIQGNRNVGSEDLLAYELGYRVQPHRRLSLDLAAFHNVYDNLVTAQGGASFSEDSPPPPHRIIPRYLDNNMRGETDGVELVAYWNPTHRWKLSTGYTWLHMRLRLKDSSGGSVPATIQGTNPRHQVQIRSYLTLLRNLELDGVLYYVGPAVAQGIPHYTRVDLRVGWHPVDKIEISIGLQNLLNYRHPEFDNFGTEPIEIKRSMYGKVLWRF